MTAGIAGALAVSLTGCGDSSGVSPQQKSIQSDRVNKVQMYDKITKLVDEELIKELESGRSYSDIIRDVSEDNQITEEQIFDIITPNMEKYRNQDNGLTIDNEEFEKDMDFVLNLMSKKFEFSNPLIDQEVIDSLTKKIMLEGIRNKLELPEFEVDLINKMYGFSTLYQIKQFDVEKINIKEEIRNITKKFIEDKTVENHVSINKYDRVDFMNIVSLFRDHNDMKSVIEYTNEQIEDLKSDFRNLDENDAEERLEKKKIYEYVKILENFVKVVINMGLEEKMEQKLEVENEMGNGQGMAMSSSGSSESTTHTSNSGFIAGYLLGNMNNSSTSMRSYSPNKNYRTSVSRNSGMRSFSKSSGARSSMGG